MKHLLVAAVAASLAISTVALGSEAELDRRLQKLEEAIARLESRLAKVEVGRSDADRGARKDRGGMMGGGMMGGGGVMGDGGMMGGGRPNEQWRAPDPKK